MGFTMWLKTNGHVQSTSFNCNIPDYVPKCFPLALFRKYDYNLKFTKKFLFSAVQIFKTENSENHSFLPPLHHPEVLNDLPEERG